MFYKIIALECLKRLPESCVANDSLDPLISAALNKKSKGKNKNLVIYYLSNILDYILWFDNIMAYLFVILKIFFQQYNTLKFISYKTIPIIFLCF